MFTKSKIKDGWLEGSIKCILQACDTMKANWPLLPTCLVDLAKGTFYFFIAWLTYTYWLAYIIFEIDVVNENIIFVLGFTMTSLCTHPCATIVGLLLNLPLINPDFPPIMGTVIAMYVAAYPGVVLGLLSMAALILAYIAFLIWTAWRYASSGNSFWNRACALTLAGLLLLGFCAFAYYLLFPIFEIFYENLFHTGLFKVCWNVFASILQFRTPPSSGEGSSSKTSDCPPGQGGQSPGAYSEDKPPQASPTSVMGSREGMVANMKAVNEVANNLRQASAEKRKELYQEMANPLSTAERVARLQGGIEALEGAFDMVDEACHKQAVTATYTVHTPRDPQNFAEAGHLFFDSTAERSADYAAKIAETAMARTLEHGLSGALSQPKSP